MPVNKKRKKNIKPQPTFSQVDMFKNQLSERKRAHDAAINTVTAMLNIMIMAVRDEFKIGPLRMARLGKRVSGMVEALRDDELNPDDVDEQLLEEIGINAAMFLTIGKQDQKIKTLEGKSGV